MNVVPKFNEFEKLFNLLGQLIPEGEYEVEGKKLCVTKDDNNLKITVEDVEDYDDSEILEFVKEFKENIKELDDQVFVESVEETDLDLHEFNRLLNLEHFSEEETESVLKMIDSFTDTVAKNLTNKINELLETSKKF